MKCGTSASIWTYIYLHRLREELGGRLTLTCVSDEETGGTWGAKWLVENFPEEFRGDCMLNGEPSVPTMLRFGEKGTLRTAARYADWWNFGLRPVADFAHKLDVLRQHCASVGRDFNAITPTAFHFINLSGQPAAGSTYTLFLIATAPARARRFPTFARK